MKTIRDLDLAGKTVILRADYNVPLEHGAISDDFRIKQNLPTLEYLLKQQCRVVIISHLGRPNGERDNNLSLRPVAQRLEELLHQPVELAEDFDTINTEEHQLTLLENIRYWSEEEANDDQFAELIARHGEVFVQDCFGVVHRSHASIVGVPRYLPACAGLLLEREVETITRAMENPERPLVAIFGGAKISDKIQIIERFIDRADKILIGGAMANTFLAYQGVEVGKSLYEKGQEEVITALAQKAGEHQETPLTCEEAEPGKVCLNCIDMVEIPRDVAVASQIDEDEPRRVADTGDIAADDYILDIGPQTIDRYEEVVAEAGTVIWNGPLGYTEIAQFAEGSNHIAALLRERKGEVESIIGGGDTAGFILHWDSDGGASFSHISTGGGAALDLMAGKTLPGLAALNIT